VLTPDCRGHGTSGGDVISYGIREADDVHRWADLLMRRPGINRLYGLGQSMGASILLESLPREPRFRALVADCPFATFEEVAYDRLRQHGGIGPAVSWPIVQTGFRYTRLRYGLNLWEASPAAAVRAAKVPVLLIHGMQDANIPPRHSRELHALNPAMTQLWEVPGADHVASLGTAPREYKRRVTAWFELY
ncbi:MAG: alpha/beta hydrolase, partial [Candidatus Solibacter sp.]|nr:alpha/beta hydrolase [Candidatus Solibacter sp.]